MARRWLRLEPESSRKKVHVDAIGASWQSAPAAGGFAPAHSLDLWVRHAYKVRVTLLYLISESSCIQTRATRARASGTEEDSS